MQSKRSLLDIAANEPCNLTLCSPFEYQIIQRFSGDRGIIPICGTLDAGSPESVEIRIFGNGETGIWEPVNATIEGSSFNCVKILPAGGWYRIEVRALKGKKVLAESMVEHVGGESQPLAGKTESLILFSI